ncbi:MAG: hypothetical protein EOO47_23625 [Flavobacterium sp.]|nr:MAG: hypothetical protein EOO47_23625 [Flavobacterium sp.]
MATLDNGINGGFRGKVGSIIGYSLHGKWVIKGLPRLSAKNKKGTPAQNACRNAFTKMQSFLSPVIDYVRIGFNLEAKKRQMTAHNVAKSYNMRNAQDADGTIDCAKVCLTFGNLPGVENLVIAKDDFGFHFTWSDNSKPNYKLRDDQVMILAYEVNNTIIYPIKSGARRAHCRESLAIPDKEKGKEFHIWVSFIADDRESISMSFYAGCFIF